MAFKKIRNMKVYNVRRYEDYKCGGYDYDNYTEIGRYTSCGENCICGIPMRRFGILMRWSWQQWRWTVVERRKQESYRGLWTVSFILKEF